MKYARLEILLVALAAFVIAGSVLVSPVEQPQWQELVAQGLVFVTFVAAVHWGRNAGTLVAAASLLTYIGMRIDLLSNPNTQAFALSMIGLRALTLGLIGVIGGEIFGRIKYFIAKAEGASMVDDCTSVYNRRYCANALKTGLGEYQRYQTAFAVALISLAPGLFTELRPSRQRSLLRSVASHMRNDIRLVDDVGYLGDGRFLLILPHTSKEGAMVCADRVRAGVRDLIGARDESVSTTVLAVPDDASAICDLARSLEPAASDQRLDDLCGTAGA